MYLLSVQQLDECMSEARPRLLGGTNKHISKLTVNSMFAGSATHTGLSSVCIFLPNLSNTSQITYGNCELCSGEELKAQKQG